MNAQPASSPLRRFLRGLTNTCLFLLLPVQLALCWVAGLDRPVRLPEFLTEKVSARLAEGGLRLVARDYWLLPDLTLAADDLSLGLEGLTGDVFVASRVELALNPLRLAAGQAEPTRLKITGGRLWCPASVARGGTRRALLEEITVDLGKEGRWLQLRSVQARGGKITCHLSGEIPAGLLRLDGRSPETAPAARRAAALLGHLETVIDLAERSGGASASVACRGRSDGGASLAGLAVFGDDWSDGDRGLIQARGLSLRGALEIAPDGRAAEWRLEGGARDIAGRGVSAERLDLRASGRGGDFVGEAGLTQARIADAVIRRLTLRARPDGDGFAADFRLLTTASAAEGSVRTGDAGTTLKVAQAIVSGEELSATPAVADALRAAGIDLRGALLMRDAVVVLGADGAVTSAGGEASASGFRGLGLSAETISPAEELPLRARFDYLPTRTAAPLRLRDLRLASVTGEADCQLQAGGAFMLHLHGALAPGSLDKVLGEWWVSLWRLFLVREHPYAFIDVESRWGASTSVTRGHVVLNRFDFMGAPFRHVEVSVDADERQTYIGLRRLLGGDSPADGGVDGAATWDWSKPPGLAGPTVRAEGDIQPWIAARCAGKEFGEALRGLALPADRRFTLLLTPGAKRPDVRTTIACKGAFTAWGVAAADLQAETANTDEGMRIGAKLGLAGGTATLGLDGDPLHRSQLTLGLKACDVAKVGQLLGELSGEGAKGPAPAPRDSVGRLDLDFKGQLELEKPRLIRGLGTFSLTDPELKKVRLLGGISNVLEAIGVGATTYELTQAKGRWGCLDGRAYFPDLAISGPQARLDLRGEVDLQKALLDFEGDFSLPRKEGFNPLDLINLNRALVSLTKIKLKGPISKPETTAIPTLKDIIKSKKDNDLGTIPASIQE